MIVVSRARLEQWLDEPFFERTVGGLLARASLPVSKNRNKYLLLHILGVVDRPEGTYKYAQTPFVLRMGSMHRTDSFGLPPFGLRSERKAAMAHQAWLTARNACLEAIYGI